MCLLIASPNKFPSTEILSLGANQNADGAGIAWIKIKNGQPIVAWEKGLELSDILKFKDKINGPHLIHFRLSTIGGKNEKLCHPFAIGEEANHEIRGEADSVLAHNGNWASFSRELLTVLNDEIVLPKGPWSDSRAMAWLAHKKGLPFLQTLNEKIAILNKNGEINLINKNMFHEHEGIFLSYDPFSRVTRSNRTSSHYPQYNYQYEDWVSPNEEPEIGCSYRTGSVCTSSGLAHYSGFKKFDTIKLCPLDA